MRNGPGDRVLHPSWYEDEPELIEKVKVHIRKRVEELKKNVDVGDHDAFWATEELLTILSMLGEDDI